jgi:hypothetical protein
VLCWCGVGAPRMGLSTAGRRREAPISFLALARAQLGLRNMSHDYNNNCCLTLDLLLTRQIISRNEHCDHVLSKRIDVMFIFVTMSFSADFYYSSADRVTFAVCVLNICILLTSGGILGIQEENYNYIATKQVSQSRTLFVVVINASYNINMKLKITKQFIFFYCVQSPSHLNYFKKFKIMCFKNVAYITRILKFKLFIWATAIKL